MSMPLFNKGLNMLFINVVGYIGGSCPSCWEGPSLLFWDRDRDRIGTGARTEGPNREAQRADSEGEVLGEGAGSLLLPPCQLQL